ncbi:hypothetical protein ACJQ40_001961 [Enterococcus faecium]|nr:hypothetical protein [Enterococcus faecium]
MEIKIRDIEPKFTKEIERRCKELSERTEKKWSRNDYLKALIENDFERPLMEYKKEQVDQMLEKFSAVQSYNTKVLQEYIDQNNQLIELLIEQSKGEFI